MSASYWEDCIDAVVTVLRALSLTGLTTSTDVISVTTPRERDLAALSARGGVLVWPGPQEQIDSGPHGGTNASDDVGYGVSVGFVKPDNQTQSDTNRDPFLHWRQLARDAFHQKRLSGVSISLICYVEPGTAISVPSWLANRLVGQLVVRCVLRETRS